MARPYLLIPLFVGLTIVPAVRAQTTVPPPATALPNSAVPASPMPTNPPPATTPPAASGLAPIGAASASPTATTPNALPPTTGAAPPASVAAPATAPSSSTGFSGTWRSPTGATDATGNLPSNNGLTPLDNAPRQPIAKVTSGTGALPNQNGQVWREYDISPYTARVTSTNRPEQAIIDWILRETGYEAWHSSVVSVLSADAKSLRVYHIPEIQAIVADVVDRFLKSEGASQSVNVRIVSTDGPSWRIRAQQVLRPVPVQTQGIQAWLIAREDASLLGTELKKRSDYREHGSPQLFINSGQSAVVSLLRPRPYTSDIVMRTDVWPGFEAKAAQFDEGMSIELSPLGSLDGRSLDAVVKVSIDQLERLQALNVDVPSAAAPRQRTAIQVPQVSQFRLHDRFRWPIESVLLISLGVVPLPSTAEATSSGGFKLPDALGGGPDRGELLMFIEAKPWQTGTQPTTIPGTTTPATQPGFSVPNILGGLPQVVPLPSQTRY